MAWGQVILPLLLVGQLLASDLGAADPFPLGTQIDELGTQIDELSTQIDKAVAETSLPDQERKLCDDYEFVRRLYLDLVGRSPNAAEVLLFVESESEDRRSELIAKLLDSSEFVNYFAGVLDIMLMERRPGKRIAQAEWIAFLENALRQEWSYDQIVRTIVAADGRGGNRASAKFILDREVEPNALTRDISRIFLGRDLQCAQCHDHPNIADYSQAEYYQLQAFLTRSYLFEDPADKKKPYIGEKAEGESEYQSVFTEDPTARAVPSLLGDLTLDAEPRYDGEKAYVVEPSKNAAAQPRFSRRVELARVLTSATNDQFARNAANRLWAHMMGRGLVHPVDFDHSENPPANPRLLRVLTEGLRHQQFRIRAFIGEIARSKVYQSSIDAPERLLPEGLETESLIARAQQELQRAKNGRQATADFLAPFQQQLVHQRTQLSSLDDEITDRANQRKASLTKIEALEKKAVELKKSLASSEKKLADASNNTEQDEEQKASKDLAKLKSAVESAKQAVQDNASETIAENKTAEGLLQQMAALKSRRVGVADSVAEARGALMAARRLKWNAPPIAHHTQHIAYLKSAESLAASQRSFDQLNEQISQTHQSLSEHIRQRDQLRSALASAQKMEAARRTTLAQLRDSIEKKRQQFDGRQRTLGELAVTLERSKDLARTLADDRLLELADSMARRREDLQSESAQFDSEISELLRESEAAKLSLENASDAKSRAHSDLQSEQDHVQQQEDQLATLKEKLRPAKAEFSRAIDEWTAVQERRLTMRQLKPLSPEQLAGATISALGLDKLYQSYAESDWKKKNKDAELDPEDQKQQAEIEPFFDKRIGQVKTSFVSLYAAPAGAPQDVFSSTADQALFLANDGRVQSWLSPGKGTLVKQLVEIESAEQLARQMYLSVLCRPPTASEVDAATDHLTSRDKDRTKAIQEMVWGLLSSVEFRFNH